MPDAITHILFAKKILGSSKTEVDTKAFYIGSMGPDPLFYYNAISVRKSKNIPMISSKIHHLPGHVPISRGFRYVNEQSEGEIKTILYSWMLGFITHYILDSRAHPYINLVSGDYVIGHKRFEMKIDTLLLKNLEDRSSASFDFREYLCADNKKIRMMSKLFSFIANDVSEQPIDEKIYIISLKHMIRVCSLFRDRTKFLKPLSVVIENLFNKKGAYQYLFYADPKPSEPDYMNLEKKLYNNSFPEIFEEAAMDCRQAFRSPQKKDMYDLDFSGNHV